MRKLALVMVLLVGGCSTSSGLESTAVVPIDLGEEVTLAYGPYEATILGISPIDVFVHRTGEVSIKEEYRDQVGLVRVEVSFENIGDDLVHPRHGVLNVTPPEELEDDVMLALAGFCEPDGEDPLGPPIRCSKLSTSGSFGVVDVYQGTEVEIAPGEASRLDYILMIDLALTELDIGFADASAEDEDEDDE